MRKYSDLYKAMPSFAGALASLQTTTAKPKMVAEGPMDPDRARVQGAVNRITGKQPKAVPFGNKQAPMTAEGQMLQAAKDTMGKPAKATKNAEPEGKPSPNKKEPVRKEPQNDPNKFKPNNPLGPKTKEVKSQVKQNVAKLNKALTLAEIREAWKHASLHKAGTFNQPVFIEKDNGPGYVKPPSTFRIRAPRQPQAWEPFEQRSKFSQPYSFIRHKPKDLFDLHQQDSYSISTPRNLPQPSVQGNAPVAKPKNPKAVAKQALNNPTRLIARAVMASSNQPQYA